MSTPDSSATGRNYAAGDRVRVRRGVTDPDFPDLPIGGWAGTVAEVDARSPPPTYLVRWGRETLLAVHPIHRKRAERDGFEIGEMWLGADDLEPDDGNTVSVELPTNVVSKPLSMADQDDRIRGVFGLTSDDTPPDVGEETLRAYHEYLSRHLRFPVEASWNPPAGPVRRVTVIGLSDPDEDTWADGMCGLLCRAKLQGEVIEVSLADCEANRGSPSQQLLADYGYWFGNFG
jgi:hypothetical protein